MISTAILCLALNIFHEARGERFEGQMAVAQVTLNRAEHDPDKVCDVVFKRKQFSWTNNLRGNVQRYMPYNEPLAWGVAKKIAFNALRGKFRGFYGGSTHYHALYVRPAWSFHLRKTATVGNHVFYKERMK